MIHQEALPQKRRSKFTRFSTIALIICSPILIAQEATDDVSGLHPVQVGLAVDTVPDLREESVPLKLQRGKDSNFFLVPIPMSSPTFGSGLILGGAYFYPQTEQQKASQPASFTGAAAGYTDNESYFAGVMQQNYWAGDKWRFNAIAGYADFKLELIAPEDGSESSLLDWLVEGGFFQASISRRLAGRWYLGLVGRYLDITQDVELTIDSTDFNPNGEIRSPAIGLGLDFDSRDVPTNAYEGRLLNLQSFFADQRHVKDGSYESYTAEFSSYHHLADHFVLAWNVSACKKSGRIPLWDTCRLNLRGFPFTDYLSKEALSAQAEARWRFYKRWGVVAFAGAGRVDDSFGGNREGDTIPSYGVGLRFMLLKSQRINVRVDYARTDNGGDAWYLSVMEAF
jgi:outer membrane protein assembly factor BamA